MSVSDIVKQLGGPVSVGRHLHIRSQAVSQWIRKNRIPAERVPELIRFGRERGVELRAEQMRPDIDWSVLRGRA